MHTGGILLSYRLRGRCRHVTNVTYRGLGARGSARAAFSWASDRDCKLFESSSDGASRSQSALPIRAPQNGNTKAKLNVRSLQLFGQDGKLAGKLVQVACSLGKAPYRRCQLPIRCAKMLCKPSQSMEGTPNTLITSDRCFTDSSKSLSLASKYFSTSANTI